MNESIQKTLLALKDVHGTQGSFVLNADGMLVAMEMPSLFDVALFADLGPRIERLAESFSALGDELESCLVWFSDHLLYVKQFAKGGALCILTESSVNLPALKMATNLAHKRLSTEIVTAQPMSAMNGHAVVAAPEVVLPTPAAAPAAEAAPTIERKTPRYYRGHLVED